jgi:hypothetical protein
MVGKEAAGENTPFQELRHKELRYKMPAKGLRKLGHTLKGGERKMNGQSQLLIL